MTGKNFPTKADLLAALRSSGEAVTATVRALPAAALESGRYEGGWNGRQILAHLERLLRTELGPEYESLDKPMPMTDLSRCNINSIASATGLNRETARRKVNQLVESGLLVKDGRAISLAPGFTQQASEVS